MAKHSHARPNHNRCALVTTFKLDLGSETQVWAELWDARPTRSSGARPGGASGQSTSGRVVASCVCTSSKHSRASPVFAIEPAIPETDVLRTNLRLSGADGTGRIRVVNKLVGALREDGFVSLDSLEVDRGKSGFIKIDVDGSECEVLDSGVSLLSEAEVCLLVETHAERLERECIERLERLGYSCQIIPNAWWRIVVPERRLIHHNRWLWATKTNELQRESIFRQGMSR